MKYIIYFEKHGIEKITNFNTELAVMSHILNKGYTYTKKSEKYNGDILYHVKENKDWKIVKNFQQKMNEIPGFKQKINPHPKINVKPQQKYHPIINKKNTFEKTNDSFTQYAIYIDKQLILKTHSPETVNSYMKKYNAVITKIKKDSLKKTIDINMKEIDEIINEMTENEIVKKAEEIIEKKIKTNKLENNEIDDYKYLEI